MPSPLVSVISIVRNGMPHIAAALQSVLDQTYPNLELIIQDCCSHDGTLEAINTIKKRAKIPVEVVSEADDGIADAYNRAVRRIRSDYFAVMDADNLFLTNHVEFGVAHLVADPALAIVATSHRMIDGGGQFLDNWQAPALDFFGQLCQERVFPSGSTLKNRRLLGEDVYYMSDPRTRHCCDYEYWLRMLFKGYKVKASPQVTYATRVSASSGSCDVGRYDQFCAEKIYTLDIVASRVSDTPLLGPTLELARAGIFMWAAESVWGHGGTYSQTLSYVSRAAMHYPAYPRIGILLNRLWQETGRDPGRDLRSDPATIPEFRRKV